VTRLCLLFIREKRWNYWRWCGIIKDASYVDGTSIELIEDYIKQYAYLKIEGA